ncbi:uncharacterized protein LOC127157900 [Labeo rohita]|uniref:uncharacterized protein LOC127157900 n=1 Tax=Labeo rohita TaxID=84645 RepID=UPI0021E22B95|nr:uncharacterized protein LOC127157900 [Labeo rohita]
MRRQKRGVLSPRDLQIPAVSIFNDHNFSVETVITDSIVGTYDQTADQLRNSPQTTDELQRIKDQHKTSMKNKYDTLFEGTKPQENKTLLNRIYTQLYIIEGESEGVNEEHEVLQMEKTAGTKHSQDTIDCNDIFKASPEPGCEEKDQIKTVLTKGIAGIGKTVSVQKFNSGLGRGKSQSGCRFHVCAFILRAELDPRSSVQSSQTSAGLSS